MLKAKYKVKPDTRACGPYRRKSIPCQEQRGDRSVSEIFVQHLSQPRLWETTIIEHDLAHSIAVAFVNRAGNILYRRFRTVEVEPGKIACWRIE